MYICMHVYSNSTIHYYYKADEFNCFNVVISGTASSNWKFLSVVYRLCYLWIHYFYVKCPKIRFSQNENFAESGELKCLNRNVSESDQVPGSLFLPCYLRDKIKTSAYFNAAFNSLKDSTETKKRIRCNYIACTK